MEHHPPYPNRDAVPGAVAFPSSAAALEAQARKSLTRPGNPVFIGGDGRSGTTLLSVMLDSHPKLAVGPELHFRGPPNLGPYVLSCLDLRDRTRSNDEWNAFRRSKEWNAGINFIHRCHRFGIEPGELRGFVEAAMLQTGGSLNDFESRCTLIDELGAHVQRRAGAQHWGIKIMRDLRVARWYAAVWPAARFIHIIRDGRDVAASQLRDHPGWGYRNVEQAALAWKDLIERGRVLGQTLQVLEIKYEDLVADPRSTLKRVLGFLEVEWTDAVLSHAQSEHSLFRHPYDHPSIRSVRQPVNAHAIGRYKRDLPEEQVREFERIAASSLRDLGYAVEEHTDAGALCDGEPGELPFTRASLAE